MANCKGNCYGETLLALRMPASKPRKLTEKLGTSAPEDGAFLPDI